MQALVTDAKAHVGHEPEEPTRVWIDLKDGSIARGSIVALSKEGAMVRLVGSSPVAPGEEVAVRLSFSRSTPTLDARARVRRVRAGEENTECELEWTHSGAEREKLARVLASRS
jgi:hypothetical protein